MWLLVILFLGTWIYLAYHWHSSRKKLKACDLILLRRELGRLLILRRIEEGQYAELVMWIDTMLKELLGRGVGITFWEERRDAAWSALRERMGIYAKSSPPWKQSGVVRKSADEPASKPVSEKPVKKGPPPIPEVVLELSEPLPAVNLELDSEDREPVSGASETATLETGPEIITTETESATPMEPEQATVSPKIQEERTFTPPEPAPPIKPEPAPFSPELSKDQTITPAEPPEVKIHEPVVSEISSEPAQVEMPERQARAERREAAEHAWKPAEPGAMERAIRSVSGWSKIIAPFLAQNILWFIGGFSFITGTIFLVALTEDFVKAMIISGALFAYTMIILGGGYKLRKKRPDLESASGVLIAIGSMLIPLSIWAAADPTDIGWPDPLKTTAGLLMAVLNIGTFYVAARVASGLAGRSLAGPYPVLFVTLASIQMAAPIVSRVTFWPIAAGFHVLILGLAGYAVKRFVDVWLKSIFLDRRRIAWFFGGTITFAALVSFVHLTWRFKGVLPDGYAGPFLMALCGLLFYADSRFKEWTARYAFLSRFTFAVYGLSIIALAIPLGAPYARLATLILGVAVYAAVLRYYLTLPPLYLLTGCLAGLYYFLILQYLPLRVWFPAGLPGLAGLVAVYGFAVRRKAAGLALTIFRCLALLTAGLIASSFIDAEPGWMSMGSALAIAGFLYYILGRAPAGFVSKTGWIYTPDDTPAQTVDLRDSHWLYLVMAACAAALAFAPVVITEKWPAQFGIGLAVFAVALTEAGLYGLGKHRTLNFGRKRIVLLNTALAGAVSSLALVYFSGPIHPFQNYPLSPVMGLAAHVFFRQSLALKVRSFVYIAAVLVAAAGSIAKYTWFAQISIGTMKILAVLAIWWVLWWIDRKQGGTSEDSQAPPPGGPLLLGFIPIFRRTFADTVRTPLQQLMVVLWAWALFRVVGFIVLYDLEPAWVVNASLETLATMLLFGHFRLQRFWPVPVLLGCGALLALVWKIGITDPSALAFFATAYAFAVWAFTSWVVNRSGALRLMDFLNLRTGREIGSATIDICTHWTAYGITLASFAIILVQWSIRPLNLPLPALFATVFAGSAFMWLSGQHYRDRSHSWPVIGATVLASFAVHTVLLDIESLGDLPAGPQTGLLLGAICMGFWIFARFADFRIVDTEQGRVTFKDSLYRKPLRLAGAALGVLGGIQETAIVWIDPGATFGQIAIAGLVLAGAGIILCNLRIRQGALNLAGIFGLSLGLLWMYAAMTDSLPFTGDNLIPPPDQWVVLAAMGLGLSIGSRFLSGRPDRWEVHGAPMWLVAVVCWLVVFANACPELVSGFQSGAVPAFVPLLFLIQCAAFLPLTRPFAAAPDLRGGVVPILLSAALFGFVGEIGTVFRQVAAVWGFGLWAVSNFPLPRFNQRLPEWAIAPATWPWFGLVSVSALALAGNALVVFRWQHWLVLSAYLFLFLRNSGWAGFAWMASCFLTLAGVRLLWDQVLGFHTNYYAIPTLVWSNLLVRIVPVWRRHGRTVSGRLGWKNPDLGKPFTVWPCIIMAGWLVYLIWEAFLIYRGDMGPQPSVAIMLVTVASFVHLFLINRRLAVGHLLILSFFTAALTAWAFVPHAMFRFPILMAIWAAVLFAAHLATNRGEEKLAEFTGLKQAISHWHAVIPYAGFIVLMAVAIYEGTVGVMLMKANVMAPDFLGTVIVSLMYWPFWLCMSVFLFVMLRSRQEDGWPYAAVLALTVAGGLLIYKHTASMLPANPVWFAFGILAWVNLLVRAAPFLRRRGGDVCAALDLRPHDLAGPFVFWPFGVASLFVAGLAWYDVSAVLDGPVFKMAVSHIVIVSLLVSLSFLHFHTIKKSIGSAHFLIFSLFATVFTAWIGFVSRLPDSMSVPAIVCGVALYGAYLSKKRGQPDGGVSSFVRASNQWLHVLPRTGFVLAGVCLSNNAGVAFQPLFWIVLTVFLFMMIRNSGNAVWPSLAVLALTLAGIAAVLKAREWFGISSVILVAAGILGWINLLLFAGSMWTKRGRAVSEALEWKSGKLDAPLCHWPFAVSLTISLAVVADVLISLPLVFAIQSILTTLMCAGTAFHLFALKKNAVCAHFLVFTLFGSALAIWIGILPSLSHLPLFLAVWCVLLCLPDFRMLFGQTRKPAQDPPDSRGFSGLGKSLASLRKAAIQWTLAVPWIGLAALVTVNVATLAETLCALAIFAAIVALSGRKLKKRGLLFAARILGLILLHTWPLFFIPSGEAGGTPLWKIFPFLKAKFELLQMLFPWWSLQLGILVLVVGRYIDRLSAFFFGESRPSPMRLEKGLGLAEWALHYYVFAGRVWAWELGKAEWINAIPAMLSAGLFCFMGIRWAVTAERPGPVYAVAVLVAAAGIYVRLLLVGFSPPAVWDTAAIMGAAFGLYMLMRVVDTGHFAEPLYKLTLVVPLMAIAIPLTALATVPFRVPSAHTATALLAAGALYLSLRHTTGRSLPLFLSALSINAAFYLWIPQWSRQTNLIQLYVAPAALSVLMLLHLHKDELRRKTLNGARLFTVCTLYACAGIDFFMGPALLNFIIALGLSLAGVVLGIILRIRAFLYGGVAFMVLTVAARAMIGIESYKEAGVVLVILGALITGGMIWFSIQREAILKRVRIFRADLERWE